MCKFALLFVPYLLHCNYCYNYQKELSQYNRIKAEKTCWWVMAFGGSFQMKAAASCARVHLVQSTVNFTPMFTCNDSNSKMVLDSMLFSAFQWIWYHHDMTEGDVVRVKHKRNHYFFQVLFGGMAEKSTFSKVSKIHCTLFFEVNWQLECTKEV